MIRQILSSVFVVLVYAAATSAIAQVAVGPGFVDAPCVHVDWSHGHVHIVAPFVNLCIQAPACCQAEPIHAEPIPPPPAQSGFRPSAGKQVVATGYVQPLEAAEASLPTWSTKQQVSLSGTGRTPEKAIARDIARPGIEELSSPR